MVEENKGRPEPVRNANGLAALLVAFANAVLLLGIVMRWWSLDSAQEAAWLIMIDVTITLGAFALSILWSRKQVTPSVDPVDVDLHPLVRLDRRPLEAVRPPDA